jgi:pyruvate,water dikinase
MVEADVAGVMFTCDPLTGAAERVIEASYGLVKSVVAGLVVPDFYRLTRDGRLLEARIAEKDVMVQIAERGGTEEVVVSAGLARRAALKDLAPAELICLADQCERIFGPSCDIE